MSQPFVLADFVAQDVGPFLAVEPIVGYSFPVSQFLEIRNRSPDDGRRRNDRKEQRTQDHRLDAMAVFVHKGVVLPFRKGFGTIEVLLLAAQEDEHPASDAVGYLPGGDDAGSETEMPFRQESQKHQKAECVLEDAPRPLHDKAEGEGGEGERFRCCCLLVHRG